MNILAPLDQLAILALYAQYNRNLDAGHIQAWCDCFTSDGVFLHPSGAFEGHAGLREFVEGRTGKLATHPVIQQRHWNDAITLAPGSCGIDGQCELLVAGVDRQTQRPVILARGRYVDMIAHTVAGWRFSRRSLSLN